MLWKNYMHLVIVLVALSAGCRHTPPAREMYVDESLFSVIEVDLGDLKQKAIANISDIATEVEYIPLETRSDNLIGKIENFFVVDSAYCIMDRMTESVLIFNADGTYSHKISRKGRGPGEYGRISGVSVDRKSKDIFIRSDINQAIFRYSWQGRFIESIPTSLIVSSFEVKDDKILFYTGMLPNETFYRSSFPEQYRYIVSQNDEVILNQLKWKYKDEYRNIPLSNDNFSQCGDTVLLTEFLDSKVYSIDSDGALMPRYRIDFLNNKYNLSWDKSIDIDRLEEDLASGRYVKLYNAFYENSNYILFNYAHQIVGFVYVNKKEKSIHNMGYVMMDDFNEIPLSSSVRYLDENYMYQIIEPNNVLSENNLKLMTPEMRKKFENLNIADNPVIVKIKLK